MLKTILVAMAVDGSPATEQVFQTVREFQLQPTTTVILSHVISSSDLTHEQDADRPHYSSEELPYRYVEKQLQVYQEQLPCQSKLEIVTGDPAEEIIRLAHIHKADLIIVGSRGLTGMKRILEGSVSSQVVAEAACSVFVVKPK